MTGTSWPRWISGVFVYHSRCESCRGNRQSRCRGLEAFVVVNVDLDVVPVALSIDELECVTKVVLVKIDE